VSAALRLWSRNRGLARSIAAGYFWPGAERQDIVQEAEIGLWIAARAWDPAGTATFKTFAALVIHRRLTTLLKSALRERQRALNEAMRAVVNDDGDEVALVELVPDQFDTERVVVARDTLARLVAALEHLSPLERAAVARAANGERYAGEKNIDNALTRARIKLRKAAA